MRDGGGLYPALVFVCNARSGADATAMVQPLMPVCTTVLSAALGLERVSHGKALGLVVATAGTSLTLRVYTVNVGPSPLDAFLLVMQANSYAVYVVLLTLALRRVRGSRQEKPPGPMLFLFASTLAAEVVIGSVGLRDLVYDVDWVGMPAEAYWAVLYAGIGSSCFAHGINSWAISHVNGILPTVYSGVQVIFTVIFAAIFLGEAVGWDRAFGSAVTIAGVALVSRAKLEESKQQTLSGPGAVTGSASSGGGDDGGRWGGVDNDDATTSVSRTSVDGIDVVVSLGEGSQGWGGGEAHRYTAMNTKRTGAGTVEMTVVPTENAEEERDETPLLGASILKALPRDPPARQPF